MAKTTKETYRNLFIYQVYLRQHTPSGTIQEFMQDLPRIKKMNVDMIYLMPIHSIGQVNKKGNLGCPYSIQDYYTINPEYGTLNDFINLVNYVHELDMKLMIDIVFNHTSFDARFLQEHKEWYYHKNGQLSGKVNDWSDITDLDFTNFSLRQALIDVLIYWAKLGVDGFRCDVASMIPLDFWISAKTAVNLINQNIVWLAESIHLKFVRELRRKGINASSDSELYQVFDILYDYDIEREFINYKKGLSNFDAWVESLLRQEAIYPMNYIKLRNLENHDTGRIASHLIENKGKLKNISALLFFLRGATMIYAGQEVMAIKKPDLFDIDKINWDNLDKENLIALFTKMAFIKKQPIFAYGHFDIYRYENGVLGISYLYEDQEYQGIFNLDQAEGILKVKFQGKYIEELTNEYKIVNEEISLVNDPIILRRVKDE